MLKDKIKELKTQLSGEITMSCWFSEQNQKKSKTIGLLLPFIDQGALVDLLAELYDLREMKKEYTQLKKKVLRDILKKHGTVCNYLRSLGPFKDVPIDE